MVNAPVQSLVPDGDGVGYWLVASDGGIFNFSDQPFLGSLGDRPPVYAVVAVAAFEHLPVGAAANPSAPSSPGGDGSPEPTTTTTTAPPTTTTTSPALPWEDASAPAGLPTEQPTHVLPCQDPSDKSAVVWYRFHAPGPWAAYNACEGQWIVMSFPGDSESDPYGDTLSVAPGSHFPDTDSPRFSPDSEEATDIYLQSQPVDGTERCPAGESLWKVTPETDGKIEYIRSCPDPYEEDEEPDGELCFGKEPDLFGTEGDDFLEPYDANDDGDFVVMGLGGNDRFQHLGLDSGSPKDVYFCGGAGDDEMHGWVKGFDGGGGMDTAYLYDCYLGSTPTRLYSIEEIHADYYECGDMP